VRSTTFAGALELATVVAATMRAWIR